MHSLALQRIDSLHFNNMLNQTIEAQFVLRAVVLHLGVASSGHYQCLLRNGPNWILCDDMKVEAKEFRVGLEEAYGDGIS